MPSRVSDKCRQCSKLSLEQALEKHGPDGTGCWNIEPCHKRRTYYKNRDRYNRDRRLKYKGDKHSTAMLDGIDIPNIPAVVIHFYRQRKDEPLHALGIELWVAQQRKTRACLQTITKGESLQSSALPNSSLLASHNGWLLVGTA